jgi:hypothetical protein
VFDIHQGQAVELDDEVLDAAMVEVSAELVASWQARLESTLLQFEFEAG